MVEDNTYILFVSLTYSHDLSARPSFTPIFKLHERDWWAALHHPLSKVNPRLALEIKFWERKLWIASLPTPTFPLLFNPRAESAHYRHTS